MKQIDLFERLEDAAFFEVDAGNDLRGICRGSLRDAAFCSGPHVADVAAGGADDDDLTIPDFLRRVDRPVTPAKCPEPEPPASPAVADAIERMERRQRRHLRAEVKGLRARLALLEGRAARSLIVAVEKKLEAAERELYLVS